MDETGFLDVADALSTGTSEGEWRSSISRAYYAAFHKARRFFLLAGFLVPQGDQAHAYFWKRLSNSGHPDVSNGGRDLNHLRGSRNRADYDFDIQMDQAEAVDLVQSAANIIQLLDGLAQEPTILASVVDTMKIYERDVLREVTWHP